MTDFEAVLQRFVRILNKGRVNTPPSSSRADLEHFRRVCETALGLARGQFGGVIFMQVKGTVSPQTHRTGKARRNHEY